MFDLKGQHFLWSSHCGPHKPFHLFLFFPLIGVEISTLWLDDGHKTYEKTAIKLSVKVIYSGTKKEEESGVRGEHTQQNWYPLPWTKTMEKQKIACLLSSLTWFYNLYEEFCSTKKLTCQAFCRFSKFFKPPFFCLSSFSSFIKSQKDSPFGCCNFLF